MPYFLSVVCPLLSSTFTNIKREPKLVLKNNILVFHKNWCNSFYFPLLISFMQYFFYNIADNLSLKKRNKTVIFSKATTFFKLSWHVTFFFLHVKLNSLTRKTNLANHHTLLYTIYARNVAKKNLKI